MIVPAPVNRLTDGRLRMDVKFVEGMRLHGRLMQGSLVAVLWDHGQSIPFGADYAPEELGFEAVILPPGAPVDAGLLRGVDGISASADMAETLDLTAGDGPPVVYSIEYTLGTRLKIVALDRSLGPLRKLWSMGWNLAMERRRRRAFRRAAGLQANGYPAFDAYRRMNPATLLYLDGRMRREMMATPDDMAAREARLASGAPLRLAHSGRLEPMKGAMDLIPVARALRQSGMAFTLDIFGAGSLEAGIRAALPEFGGAVRLHAPVDFETALVPWMRAQADLFLSCHRQSDPSCTYLETMGCGVPVIGYDNGMWQRMQEESGAGWVVPMGDVAAMAAQIQRLDGARDAFAAQAGAALKFAQDHDFETEFRERMRHQAACLSGD